jgi:hypothetical protein
MWNETENVNSEWLPMKENGARPAGVEVGNAWSLRPASAQSNWVVGEVNDRKYGEIIPPESLRFMLPNSKATNVSVKWFVHEPTDDPSWGKGKKLSEGRTISILVDGEMELRFGDSYKIILDEPGDFAIWGEKISHDWAPIKKSTVMTVRWTPVDGASDLERRVTELEKVVATHDKILKNLNVPRETSPVAPGASAVVQRKKPGCH